MDAYFKKIDEISKSLDQLLKERFFLNKILGLSGSKPEQIHAVATVRDLNDNTDKINTIDLLLSIYLKTIETHASVSGQTYQYAFNELTGKIKEAQTKLESLRISEHRQLTIEKVISEESLFKTQTPFLKPPSPSLDNDNSYSPGSGA